MNLRMKLKRSEKRLSEGQGSISNKSERFFSLTCICVGRIGGLSF